MFVRRLTPGAARLAVSLPTTLMLGVMLGACKGGAEAPPAAAPTAEPAATPAPVDSTEGQVAVVGQPAPEFSLPDLDGNTVSLADFKGKTVVLEWFNPGCPFVQAAHTKGSLKDMAAQKVSEDLVWFAINSGGAGKQGNGVEANREGVERFGIHYPVLIDESGQVGRSYGAERTPHMFVIGPDGVLVYRGAVDNSPDGTRESPEGGQLVNYVEQAIGALRSGATLEAAETKPYGCSVKYGSI